MFAEDSLLEPWREPYGAGICAQHSSTYDRRASPRGERRGVSLDRWPFFARSGLVLTSNVVTGHRRVVGKIVNGPIPSVSATTPAAISTLSPTSTSVSRHGRSCSIVHLGWLPSSQTRRASASASRTCGNSTLKASVDASFTDSSTRSAIWIASSLGLAEGRGATRHHSPHSGPIGQGEPATERRHTQLVDGGANRDRRPRSSHRRR